MSLSSGGNLDQLSQMARALGVLLRAARDCHKVQERISSTSAATSAGSRKAKAMRAPRGAWLGREETRPFLARARRETPSDAAAHRKARYCKVKQPNLEPKHYNAFVR